MVAVNVKVSIKEIDLFNKRQAKKMMSMIRDDVQISSERGEGPSGAYAPYKTPDLIGIPVDLTQTGTMLGKIRTSVRKDRATLKPGAFYGRFINDGTKKMAARPWLVLRPRTLSKLQRWTKLRLERAFAAKTMREVIS